VGRAAPDGVETEAFTWVSSALIGGLAAGAALGGAAVASAGFSAPFAVGCAAMALAGFSAVTRRGHLERRPA
jgi:predicted MFS family arabinose efflux permease